VFGLGADVIVGFPGETDRDHVRTLELVRRLPYTYLHVFPYSERPGAAARRLGSPVPAALARRRGDELRALAAEKGSAYRARRVGEWADVVWLSRRAGWYEGLTGDYLTAYLESDRAAPCRGPYRLDLADGRLVAERPGPSAEHHQGPGPRAQGRLRVGA
jgi:threonylcarbamoyladenosine tRNA methylthiotransferase MtaB